MSANPSTGASESPRPRQATRSDEILAAALEAFATNGFAATRLDAVARRAGISKGTIYLYFPSKEALFAAVVRETTHPLLAELEALVADQPDDAEETLRRLLRLFYHEVAGNESRRRVIRLMLCEGNRFPALRDFYYREVVAPGVRLIVGFLKQGQSSGAFQAQVAIDHPQVVIGPIIMAAIWRLLFEDAQPLDLDALAEAHAAVLLGGIRGKAVSP